jgi:subtilisin family serine protease
MHRFSLLALSALTLAACQDAVAPTPQTDAPAPHLSVASVGDETAEPIAGKYIVVFKDGVRDVPGVARALARANGGTVRFTYQRALRGFAADLPDRAAVALAHNPNVAFVEQDQVMHAFTTEANATWGIDRIDQHNLPLSTTYTYTNTGAGVTAYIIDTGIRFDHSEFGGRAVSGFDAVTSGGNAADCNGHGTHVSGTVGGATYGVAKGVRLVAVRVLGCTGSGSTSGVIAGIDWVTSNHATGQPAVANMSLGGSASTALDNAVRNSIADGVSYAIAAGNGNQGGIAQDACKYSPARVAEAMTIGATDKTDRKASWSNYGNCVDWFAPGVSITSAWYTSTTATNTISGTSMATPHTTGVAALYLQTNPGASPQQVRDALYANTTKGVVTSSKTTNNHLLFTSY